MIERPDDLGAFLAVIDLVTLVTPTLRLAFSAVLGFVLDLFPVTLCPKAMTDFLLGVLVTGVLGTFLDFADVTILSFINAPKRVAAVCIRPGSERIDDTEHTECAGETVRLRNRDLERRLLLVGTVMTSAASSSGEEETSAS